jgi:glycosyltransferase involved in cell wall biosynthesis
VCVGGDAGDDRHVTGTPGQRLGDATPPAPRGVRVVLDARPLQAPDRAPLAAAYLDGLLGAFDAEPLAGESFAILIGSDLDDPTTRYERLDVVGRRQLPPTRLLRSGLAPWELPGAFQRSVAGRFGQRLRAQLLREAAAVIVGTDATARAARRTLRIRRDRIRVVGLAPRTGFAPTGPEGSREAAGTIRDRLGLPERYLVLSGRFDARLDLTALLDALAALAGAGRPEGLDAGVPWPPRVLLVGASPDDRASIARAASRKGVGEILTYAPGLAIADLAGLVRGARGVILPVVSEAAGLSVIEALACGTPVVASAVGPLPELVGAAGLLVEPRDAERLAVALATIWADPTVHGRIASIARERAELGSRSWADVARETRTIYDDVGTARGPRPGALTDRSG